MTDQQLALARWTQRMIEAGKLLQDPLKSSLEAWLAAGEKRSSWAGWERMIGPRPEVPQERKQVSNAGTIHEIKRNTA